MKKNPIAASISIENIQELQAYFSHSYREEDRQVNLFFWGLFSQEDFFFTVDPKSEKFIVPHLERMMRYCDCFIAVVTRRLEKIYQIDDVVLPKPQSIWTHSTYIAFENYLAELFEKPRLVFVESGLDANIFRTSEEVCIFERTTLEKSKREYRDEIHKFAEKVRAYVEYKGYISKRTGKAGILIEPVPDENSYSQKTIEQIGLALNAGGYSAEVITPRISNYQSFIRKLSDLELVIAEIRPPYIKNETLAFIQAKSLPCIRLAKLNPHETSINDIELPDILKEYQVGDDKPVIAWKKKDELIFEIILQLSKFQQTRTLLDTFEQGKRYFLSAGRKAAKIFISNPHSLNPLALELVKGFQTVNIQFFQYQSSLRIGTAWREELDKELREFDIFIALINDDYHKSEYCQLELSTAFERWKKKEVKLLPYIVEQTRLPELIKNHIQCAFVHNLSQEELTDQIVSTVDDYLIIKEQKPKGDYSETLGNEILGKEKKWAVLVGVDYYEDKIHFPALHVCVKDTLAINDRLIECGYESDRIKILTDHGTDIPTRDNILVALKSLALATEPDDLLLFYYSGHGVEYDGESYLVSRSGRSLVIDETAVSISKVKDLMKAAQARAKIIIIDACHSGVNFGKGEETMPAEFIQRVFEEAKGFAILSSCEQGQVSYEWRQNNRSVFTQYLLEGLSGSADKENKGFITVHDIHLYVTNAVKLWASKKNLSQTPTLHYEVSGDIAIVHLGSDHSQQL